MKKTYNLYYEQGKYYCEYSKPGNVEEKLVINEKDMEIDSAQLYRVFFEKTSERIEIVIKNKITDSIVNKKAERICRTLQELCDEICLEINKKCYSETEGDEKNF